MTVAHDPLEEFEKTVRLWLEALRDGESMDAKSAAWARRVCGNIQMTAEQYMEEGRDE